MKKMNAKLIVLLILGLLGDQVDSGTIQMAKQAAEFAWNAFGVANTVHDTYSKITTPSTTDLMEKTDEIAQSLDNWGGRLEVKMQQSVDLLLTHIPLLNQISEDILVLDGFIGRIDELYADYRFYLEDPESFDEEELLKLIDAFTSRKNDDVQGTVFAMHNLIIPLGFGNLKKSLFLILGEQIKDPSLDLCGTFGSPQQRLAQLYDIIIGTEMKAYTMIIFGYTMEGYIYKVRRSSALQMVRDKFIARAKQYLTLFKEAMGQAPTFFRQCDPPEGHERGVTYVEFENFLTRIAFNQYDMVQFRSCGRSCEDLSSSQRLVRNDDGQNCGGSPIECSMLSGHTTYCLGQAGGLTRPRWIKDEERTYGDDSEGCPGDIRLVCPFHNNYGHLCKVCSCVCVEDAWDSPGNRFISLRDQMANIAENMVVTGIRFVMQNRMLYVQVRQGQLGRYTDIPENSSSWVELEDYVLNPQLSKWRRGYRFNLRTPDGEIPQEDPNIGFGLYSWGRRINLDLLTVPEDHAITGVRFQRLYNGDGSQIQLEIHATAFDADTGELDPTTSHWIKPEDMPYAKGGGATRVDYGKLEEKRNPAYSWATQIDTSPYTFIDIDSGDIDEDGAHTTIPLIDILPVISQPPTPLVSIGLYHKRQPGHGGFLTFILGGLNVAKYLPDA